MKWLALLSGLAVLGAAYPGETVADFKKWKRLTDEPAYMPDVVATMCAMPSRAAQADPHRGHLIDIYVNPTGQEEALRALSGIKKGQPAKKVKFPEGTVLVKAKYATRVTYDRAGGTPEKTSKPLKVELLTVMIKEAKLTSPNTGDWKFLIMDAGGKKVLTDNRQSSCWSCHKDMKSDYVSLAYQKLKSGR